METAFIDIWHGNLVVEAPCIPQYMALLSHEEKIRAGKYDRLAIKHQYISTRAIVRKILAEYLSKKPSQIELQSHEYGKPYIKQGGIFFNLSHTGQKFVLAVSNIKEVGIDLERRRQRKNLSAIVKKCFSDAEVSYWEALSDQQQEIMFYRFWVRKEAFVKAVGRGIALGLCLCEIDLVNHNCFSSIPDGYGAASDWLIHDVQLSDDCYCAYVMQGIVPAHQLIAYS